MSYPTPKQLSLLYKQYDDAVHQLTQLPMISKQSVQGLHRHVLTRLASEAWGLLSHSAREELLNHTHHFVRSCASLAQAELDQVLASEVKTLDPNQLHLRRQDLSRRRAEMIADSRNQDAVDQTDSRASTELASIRMEIAAIDSHLNALPPTKNLKHAGTN